MSKNEFNNDECQRICDDLDEKMAGFPKRFFKALIEYNNNSPTSYEYTIHKIADIHNWHISRIENLLRNDDVGLNSIQDSTLTIEKLAKFLGVNKQWLRFGEGDMNQIEYEVLWKKWRDLIGNFIMEFSEIEYISYSLWFKNINDGQPAHQFTARTKQVISKLNNKNHTPVKALLEQAIHIAKKRNTIVHNPTLMQIFNNKTTGITQSQFTISTFVTGDSINLSELKELTAEATSIKTKLYMILGYLPHEDNND